MKILVSDHIKEAARFNEVKSEIEKIICEESIAALNESEKIFIEKFPDYVIYQSVIKINEFFQRDIIGMESKISYWSDCQPLDPFIRFTDDSSRRVPRIISCAGDLKNFPKLQKRLVPKIKEAHDYLSASIDRIKAARCILDSSDITTAELKKYSPKLWKLYEDNK